MINLVWDKIRDERTFALYAKRFIPKVYNLYLSEKSHRWDDINGNNVVSAIIHYTLITHDDLWTVRYTSWPDLLHDSMLYIIENRHLDEFWVEHEALKKL